MANEPDYAALCLQPGPDGVMWRLLNEWRIEAIPRWLKGEQARGTEAMTLGPQFGRALAVATMHAADHFNDREAFITNEKSGVGHAYAAYLRAMVLHSGAHKSPGGIVIPPAGLLH